MYIDVLPACVPGTRVVNTCELPCGFWELNAGPLEESQCIHPQSHLSRFNRILTGHLV